MLSPTERAEKIYGNMEALLATPLAEKIGIEMIAAEIREAVEEATKAQFVGDKEHYEARIEQARAEAFEEAAKIIERCETSSGEPCDHCVSAIEQIRSRAKEIK